MKKSRVKEFTYTKDNGEISYRKVFQIYPPDDKMLAIDLSEFDEEEQAAYIETLNAIFSNVTEEIREAGLETCYRYFKKEKIISIKK